MRKSESANEFSRICSCEFKVKSGNLLKIPYLSTQNLFKPSIRDGKQQQHTLAEMCKEIGSYSLSDRVCKPCGRKIKTTYEYFTFIDNGLSQGKSPKAATSLDTTPQRFKRLQEVLKSRGLPVVGEHELTTEDVLSELNIDGVVGKSSTRSDRDCTFISRSYEITCYKPSTQD
jgi:ribosomal protein L32